MIKLLIALCVICLIYIVGAIVSYAIIERYNSKSNRYNFKGTPAEIASQNVKRSVRDATVWPISLILILIDKRSSKAYSDADKKDIDSLLTSILNKYSAESDEFLIVARNQERGYTYIAKELDKINSEWRNYV